MDNNKFSKNYLLSQLLLYFVRQWRWRSSPY